MKVSVGIKIGGGFAAVLIMLLIAGGFGLRGAVKLGNNVDYLSQTAWPLAQASNELAQTLQQQSSLVTEVIESLGSGSATKLAELKKSRTTAESLFSQLKSYELVSGDTINELDNRFKNFSSSQAKLLASHSAYVAARKEAFAGFNKFELYMDLVQFYNNQIFSLPSVDQGDKWDLQTYFFQSKAALSKRFFYLQRYLGGDDPDSMLDKMEGAWDDLSDEAESLAELEVLENSIKSGEYQGKSYIEVLESLLESHRTQFDKLVDFNKAFISAKVEYIKVAADFNGYLEVSKRMVSKVVAEETEGATETKYDVYKSISVALVTGFLIAVAATVICLISVVKPIIVAGHRMEDIASGEGDLTRTINVKGNDEVASMAESFNNFVGTIRSTVAKIIDRAEDLTQSATQLQNQADSTRAATAEQREGSEQIAVALNEMSSAVQEVAKNAADAQSSTQEANNKVNESQQVVSTNRQAISELSSEIQSASEVVRQLEGESQAVGSILDVIKAIAEQTNLLALNAAIEAARAGEQGRGFAVVADEVRTLAQRTQDATNEIQKVIAGLQSKSNEAVSVMEGSRDRAEHSVASAEAINQLLNELRDSVNECLSMNIQIATAAEEQVSVTEEINRHVNHISDLSGTAAAGAEANSETSLKVAELADQLTKMTNRFKV
ncbi:methyl-accepting chemotaxis protein [Litoribacillus peritrichatus]|uniref:Methyl-accepting chemotaxis protein n=1 Tax=Litoribacillus peritrichatus TaxID=718191 RepID=A0ABP7NDW0_9GAMM